MFCSLSVAVFNVHPVTSQHFYSQIFSFTTVFVNSLKNPSFKLLYFPVWVATPLQISRTVHPNRNQQRLIMMKCNIQMLIAYSFSTERTPTWCLFWKHYTLGCMELVNTSLLEYASSSFWSVGLIRQCVVFTPHHWLAAYGLMMPLHCNKLHCIYVSRCLQQKRPLYRFRNFSAWLTHKVPSHVKKNKLKL